VTDDCNNANKGPYTACTFWLRTTAPTPPGTDPPDVPIPTTGPIRSTGP